jgi:hypothetical protein
MGAFEFDTGNHKVIFKAPRFDSNGQFQGVENIEMGEYSITDGVLKITFYPVKDNTRFQGQGIFPDSAKGVMFLRRVDTALAQQAQQNNVTTGYIMGQGLPPAVPQVGNILVMFGVAELKGTFYKEEKYVKSKMLDPFAVLYAPGAPPPEEGEVVESFEKFICDEYIGDERVTLEDVDSNQSVTVYCQDEELKFSFNDQVVDFNEDTATLSACPMFQNAQNGCGIVRADFEGLRICALRQNGMPDESNCKFYVNDDRLEEDIMENF